MGARKSRRKSRRRATKSTEIQAADLRTYDHLGAARTSKHICAGVT